jgi:hypothetical protein
MTDCDICPSARFLQTKHPRTLSLLANAGLICLSSYTMNFATEKAQQSLTSRSVQCLQYRKKQTMVRATISWTADPEEFALNKDYRPNKQVHQPLVTVSTKTRIQNSSVLLTTLTHNNTIQHLGTIIVRVPLPTPPSKSDSRHTGHITSQTF